MGRLFGTDGVRGVANSQLTPQMAYKLGKALCWADRSRAAPPL